MKGATVDSELVVLVCWALTWLVGMALLAYWLIGGGFIYHVGAVWLAEFASTTSALICTKGRSR